MKTNTPEEIKTKLLFALEHRGCFKIPSRKTLMIGEFTEQLKVAKQMVLDREVEWTVDFNDKSYLFYINRDSDCHIDKKQ